MKVEMSLKSEKASEIREVISEEFEHPSEDHWAGTANVVDGPGDRLYEYTTGTGEGRYTLHEDNVLVFSGRRNSFLSGTMIFQIEEKDVENWKMLESQQPARSLWDVGILNLTQHDRSEEQFSAGVVDLFPSEKDHLKKLLSFEALPTEAEVQERAKEIATIAHYAGYPKVMIGGAPYLMSALERELVKAGVIPTYAFSQRVSEEEEIDGKVVKIQVFKHLGFVGVNI